MILLSASRPGAFECLNPLFSKLNALGIECAFVVSEVAAEMTSDPKITKYSGAPGTDQCEQILNELAPNVVVTALVGSAEVGFDRAMVRVAKRMDKLTVSVLDSWVNLSDRVHSPGHERDFGCVPHLLAVMDAEVKAELASLGVNQEQIVVTGQPAFDARVSQLPERKAALCARLGIPSGVRLYAFFSEPLEISPSAYPFNQGEALQCLVDGLAMLEADSAVIVKPHPVLEQTRKLVDRGRVKVCYAPQDWLAIELLEAADVVAGISSTLLVRAYISSRPVIVCHPGHKIENDRFVLSKRNLLRPARTPADIKELALNDNVPKPVLAHVGNASENIVKAILAAEETYYGSH